MNELISDLAEGGAHHHVQLRSRQESIRPSTDGDGSGLNGSWWPIRQKLMRSEYHDRPLHTACRSSWPWCSKTSWTTRHQIQPWPPRPPGQSRQATRIPRYVAAGGYALLTGTALLEPVLYRGPFSSPRHGTTRTPRPSGPGTPIPAPTPSEHSWEQRALRLFRYRTSGTHPAGTNAPPAGRIQSAL